METKEIKKRIESARKRNHIDKYGITGNTGLGIGGIFHVSMPYSAGENMVFVEHQYTHRPTGDKWDSWKRMPLDKAVRQKKKIIKCFQCDKPAVSLDHHWPYMVDYNACADHFGKRPEPPKREDSRKKLHETLCTKFGKEDGDKILKNISEAMEKTRKKILEKEARKRSAQIRRNLRRTAHAVLGEKKGEKVYRAIQKGIREGMRQGKK